jgi:hypothetical protein
MFECIEKTGFEIKKPDEVNDFQDETRISAGLADAVSV